MQNFTKKEVDKVQFDEAVVFTNYGIEGKERLLGPNRGGGDFTATETIRDVEYDGRQGKTKGMQILESQDAVLKLTTLCSSQENLKLALPGASMSEAGVIESKEQGHFIEDDDYLENVTCFAKLKDGTFKKITIYNALHEAAMTFNMKPKTENEHSLEFNAHYDAFDRTKKLYKIEDVESLPTSMQN